MDLINTFITFGHRMKVSGLFADAYNQLTVGQYNDARRDLFGALGLSPDSRTAFLNYVNNKTPLKYWQIENAKLVFAKYGIIWQPKFKTDEN